jgi:hydroxymethylpyrimidine pyrophosphatase-like HAD family hydrolase
VMSGQPVAFVDLDDTLFASRKKQSSGIVSTAAVDRRGAPNSFLNQTQAAFWEWLTRSGCTIVPATTRSLESFRRVQLPFQDHAICAAGSIILDPAGVRVAEWERHVRHCLSAADVASVERLLEANVGRHDACSEPIINDGQIRFFRVHHPSRTLAPLSELRELLERQLGSHWTLQLTHNHLSIVLRQFSKRAAVLWLLKNRFQHATFSMGAGDSLGDIDFMAECDYSLGPQNSHWQHALQRQLSPRGKQPEAGPATVHPDEANSDEANSDEERVTWFSGSYAKEDVTFLLRPIKMDSVDIDEKERLLQSGAIHYSEVISRETPPDTTYLEHYFDALKRHQGRLAGEVLRLAATISGARPNNRIALVSLARAGTPIGVLLHRTLRKLGRESSHFSISIIRDRGIDFAALDRIRREFDDHQIIFVDGWTGKGTIQGELTRTVRDYNLLRKGDVPSNLAVLLDLSGHASYRATSDDYLLPCGMLNCVVSGLVSRSIMPRDSKPGGDFHCCVYYEEYKHCDQSHAFVDKIDSEITRLVHAGTPDESAEQPPNGLFAARHLFLDEILTTFGIQDKLLVKPGIGEATRALMRRVPARLLVQDRNLPDLQHAIATANLKDVAVEEVADMPYAAVAFIRSLGQR